MQHYYWFRIHLPFSPAKKEDVCQVSERFCAISLSVWPVTCRGACCTSWMPRTCQGTTARTAYRCSCVSQSDSFPMVHP